MLFFKTNILNVKNNGKLFFFDFIDWIFPSSFILILSYLSWDMIPWTGQRSEPSLCTLKCNLHDMQIDNHVRLLITVTNYIEGKSWHNDFHKYRKIMIWTSKVLDPWYVSLIYFGLSMSVGRFMLRCLTPSLS